LARIQSQQNSVRFAISETVAAAAGIVSIISVRYFFGTSTTLLFLGGMAFGYGTSVIYNLGTKKSEPSSTPTFQLAKGLFRFGAPLTVWLFISSLFNIADRFMIQHFYGYGAVGTYSAVYDLIYKISAFLSMPVLLSYHPSITSSWNNSEKNTTAKLIRTAVLLECLVLIGLILLFLVGSDWLFKLLMRGEHLPTGNWFYALLLSSMVWQISLLLHKPLELRMQLDKMLIGILISLLLNLLLNYLLLPAYGYTAAAWTTLACTLFYACWVIVIDKLNAKK
jgi:O-antigen/teichoic acid export membrane protein